ncbi:MAG: ComF family protein [Eubacteriales bacterium]|nr:ComF family protein [Eubacteriales bacterium]
MGIGEVLRYLEGDNRKCIFCGRRRPDIIVESDGVGICRTCYEHYMRESVKDYYETDELVRRLFAPFLYTGRMRRALLDLKFNDCRAYAEPLGKLVAESLPPYYLYSDYDMLLPVPLHPKRLEERGFNQAELIARTISKYLGVPCCDDVLFRIRDTKRQMNLSRAQRHENVEGAFYADGKSVAGKRIMLIDDIYTAGATVRECAKELRGKGAAEVSAIVVCSNFMKNYNDASKIQIPIVK